MRIKKVTEQNLEFLVEQFHATENLNFRTNADTYAIYDGTTLHAIINIVRDDETPFIDINTKNIVLDRDGQTPTNSYLFQLLPLPKKFRTTKDSETEKTLSHLGYEKIEEGRVETYKLKEVSLKERLENLRFMNLSQQLKDYFHLWKEEPEFGLYELMNIVSLTTSGFLMGSIMPSFWNYGGTMKLAGTLAAIQKIGTPLTNVAVSGTMGSVVDKASKDTNLENLKGLQKKVGSLHAFLATDTWLMQENMISLSPNPAATLLILFGLQTLGSTAGRMALESKSHYAIKDYLIRQNPEIEKKYSEKFYQLIGTGQALAQLGSAAAFTISWLGCVSHPDMIFPTATISGLVLIASKFAWAYQRKIKNPITIEADDFLYLQQGYSFNTGWQLETDQPIHKIRNGFRLPLGGKIIIKSREKFKIYEKKRKLELKTAESHLTLKSKNYEYFRPDEKKIMIRKI